MALHQLFAPPLGIESCSDSMGRYCQIWPTGPGQYGAALSNLAYRTVWGVAYRTVWGGVVKSSLHDSMGRGLQDSMGRCCQIWPTGQWGGIVKSVKRYA
jgi:hypothetical protein